MQPLKGSNATPSVDPESINIVGVARGTLTSSGTSSGTYTVYIVDSPFVQSFDLIMLQFCLVV